MIIQSKAAFDALSPLTMYTSLFRTIVLRNVLLCGSFQLAFKLYPQFTAYCQKNAYAASLVRWRNMGRLFLPLMDLSLQIGAAWAMTRLGYRVTNCATLFHMQVLVDSSVFNWFATVFPPLGRVFVVGQAYLPMEWGLVKSLLYTSSIPDYLLTQVPMMSMSLVQELVGVVYRGYVNPAAAKRSVKADLVHMSLQWSIATVACTVMPIDGVHYLRDAGTADHSFQFYRRDGVLYCTCYVCAAVGRATSGGPWAPTDP